MLLRLLLLDWVTEDLVVDETIARGCLLHDGLGTMSLSLVCFFCCGCNRCVVGRRRLRAVSLFFVATFVSWALLFLCLDGCFHDHGFVRCHQLGVVLCCMGQAFWYRPIEAIVIIKFHISRIYNLNAFFGIFFAFRHAVFDLITLYIFDSSMRGLVRIFLKVEFAGIRFLSNQWLNHGRWCCCRHRPLFAMLNFLLAVLRLDCRIRWNWTNIFKFCNWCAAVWVSWFSYRRCKF